MTWRSICELTATDSGDIVWSPKRTDLGIEPVVIGNASYAEPMVADAYKLGLSMLLPDVREAVMRLNARVRQVRREREAARRVGAIAADAAWRRRQPAP
jgi:hypothetical protein